MPWRKKNETEIIIGYVVYMQMKAQITLVHELIILNTTIILPTLSLFRPIFTRKTILTYKVNCNFFHFKQPLDVYKPMYLCVCLSKSMIKPYKQEQQ